MNPPSHIRSRFMGGIHSLGGSALRLSTATCVVIAFALSLNAILNYFNFSRAYAEIVEARLTTLSKDLRSAAEYALNLGFQLAEAKTLAELIHLTSQRHPEIDTLSIADLDGNLLLSSRTGYTGTPVKALIGDLSGIWNPVHSIAGDIHYLVTPLRNSFGLPVGALVIEYPDKRLWPKRKQVLVSLGLQTLAILALVMPVFFLLTLLVTQRLRRSLSGLERQLVDPGRPSRPDAPAATDAFAHVLWNLFRLERRLERVARAMDKAGGKPS